MIYLLMRKIPVTLFLLNHGQIKEALDIHCNSEHFRRIIPMIKQYTKAESKITFSQ